MAYKNMSRINSIRSFSSSSKMSKIKSKIMSQTTNQTNSKKGNSDINQQIAELDEKKLRLTFKDIWADYKNFRSAYYFTQYPSPKEYYEKAAVHVDTKNFKIGQFFFDLAKNHGKHPYLSPSYFFTSLALMLITFYTWRLVRRPVEIYYHWDDPLITKISDEEVVLSSTRSGGSA